MPAPALHASAPDPLRIALYTRTATTDGGALAAQESRLRAFLPVPHVLVVTFRDNGVSGLTLHRPGLRALLAAIDAGEIDAVAVTSLDRLSRSPQDYARLLRHLESRNVQLLTPDGPVDVAFQLLALSPSATPLHP